MQAFSFGNPNLFVKGIVEQIFRDPTSGNIVAFDKVASEAALNYTFNLQEITGGFGNKLVGLIPDTTRLSGTYTSQAFSLIQRALLSGGNLSYDGITPVCEKVKVTSGNLVVSQTPVKDYSQNASDTLAWCYFRKHGESNYVGTNYGIDINTKQVNLPVGTVLTDGDEYDVFYFTANASAQVLALPSAANPAIVSIQQKWGVYAKQNNSISQGTLQGYLYVNVPKAQLNGDAGINGNQTTNSTTEYNWTAVSSDDNSMVCDSCSGDNENLAYYIYVPCNGNTASVENLAIIGAGITVAVSAKAQIPVKYVMPDGSLVQPVYSDLTYVSTATSTATVSPTGEVTGVASGDTEITITLNKGDGTTLTAICPVTVS